jgi:hypothetical protein
LVRREWGTMIFRFPFLNYIISIICWPLKGGSGKPGQRFGSSGLAGCSESLLNSDGYYNEWLRYKRFYSYTEWVMSVTEVSLDPIAILQMTTYF